MLGEPTDRPRDRDLVVFRFLGYSMFPFLRPGDRLIVKQGSCGPPGIGDIVLFSTGPSLKSGKLTAHRVVGRISEDRFITKGDNLPRQDPGLRHTRDIQGLVVMVARNGRLRSLASGLRGRAGRWVACFSRNNLTPGIILSRLRRLAGRFP